jgi:hypothetical protein
MDRDGFDRDRLINYHRKYRVDGYGHNSRLNQFVPARHAILLVLSGRLIFLALNCASLGSDFAVNRTTLKPNMDFVALRQT